MWYFVNAVVPKTRKDVLRYGIPLSEGFPSSLISFVEYLPAEVNIAPMLYQDLKVGFRKSQFSSWVRRWGESYLV